MTSGVYVDSKVGSNCQNYPAIIPGTVQALAFTGTSAQSSALGATTTMVRLIASAACHVAFGTNPTATTSNMYLAANVPEYFGVTPSTKIAAIQVSGGGNLNITEAA